MDAFISAFDAVEDGDLRLCIARGVAYQADMSQLIEYGDDYHNHYAALEGSPIAVALNAGRCAMVARHVPAESSVLDIGAGSGEFVKTARSWGYDAKGFDVIPKTVEALKRMEAFADNPEAFDVVTFWDSLEHIEHPGEVLRRVRTGATVLVAIPIIDDLTKVRDSKHFKPGEHLMYFTSAGFIAWMALYGFRLLETSTHETDAGRESIGAFAFRRDTVGRCPCGGDAYVDEFDWPGKARQFFLRCATCGGMSDAVASAQEAQFLAIKPEQALEAKG